MSVKRSGLESTRDYVTRKLTIDVLRARPKGGAMERAGEAQFHRLWPTLFMSLNLPGAETANPVLTDLFLKQDDQTQGLTEGYLDQDVFAIPHPAVGWLRRA